MRYLYKSKDNKVFTGTIGGLGEYLGVDPVILRLIWVSITIFTAAVPGVLTYIIAALIVPSEPATHKKNT